MGNQQLKSNVDNKFFQSSFSLKEHSNMPPSDTKQKKKVRFNSKLQNELTVPYNNKPQKYSTRNFLDVNYGDKKSRLRYTDSEQIPEDRKSMIITSSENIQNQEEDSLRATHIDADTKKSQMKQNSPSLFSILTPDKLVSHKSMLHEKVQDQTKFGIEEIKKSKSRSECRIKPYVNEQITQEKCEQQSPQEKQPRQNKMRIPSAIDDVDTIQLNQSNPGMWLKNTLKSSQNTVKQIFNQNYTQKGYFVLTDTVVGNEEIQKSEIKSKFSEEYQESERSTQCECNLIIPFIKLFSSRQKEGNKRLYKNQMQNSNDSTQNKIIAEKKGNLIEKRNEPEQDIVSKSY